MEMNGSASKQTTADEAEARRALDAVVASAAFGRSKRGRELLAYLVEKTLDGRQDEIKAFSIACDVFGRDQNFDADNDALVRVQAARVRTLLAEYYANEGKDEPLRISLPKGGYIPVFERLNGPLAAEEPALPENSKTLSTPPAASDKREPKRFRSGLAGWLVAAMSVFALAAFLFASPQMTSAPPPSPPAAVTDGSISVLAASFVKFSPDVSDKSLEFIQSQLLQLSQLSFVTIFSDKAARLEGENVDPMEVARRRGINYLLEGRILGADGALRVNIDLLDVKSGKYVWTQSYDQQSTIEELALSVMSSLHIVLLKAASSNAREVSLDSATPWDLYFLATWINGNTRNSLEWEKERVSLARRAIRGNADFGPAYSLLASKLAYLANVDPPSDTPQTHSEAKYFARQALEKSPGDADVAFNLALYNWHSGHLSDALMLMRRTLDLAPHHPLARFLVNVIPYTCTTAPPEAIEQLIAYDAHLPANGAERWVTLTWVALLYLNNGDFQHAVDYSRRSFAIFHSPDSMYRFAAALAHAGKAREALELIEDQEEFWPSLDPKHYANVVIPRRCDGASRESYLHGLYLDLAAAENAGPPRLSAPSQLQ